MWSCRKTSYYMEEGLRLRLEKDYPQDQRNKMAVLKMDEYIKNRMVLINLASREVEKARSALQTSDLQEKGT